MVVSSVSAGQPLVLVMALAPMPGAVLPSLVADLGEVTATWLYRRLGTRQIEAVPTGWEVEVCFSPPAETALMRGWLGSKVSLFPQPESDEHARRRSAWQRAQAAAECCVLMVGVDCPSLGAADLERAVGQLLTHAVVLGPTRAGGLYLLGARSSVAAELLFPEAAANGASAVEVIRHGVVVAGLRCAVLGEREVVTDLASLARMGGIERFLPESEDTTEE